MAGPVEGKLYVSTALMHGRTLDHQGFGNNVIIGAGKVLLYVGPCEPRTQYGPYRVNRYEFLFGDRIILVSEDEMYFMEPAKIK